MKRQRLVEIMVHIKEMEKDARMAQVEREKDNDLYTAKWMNGYAQAMEMIHGILSREYRAKWGEIPILG